MPGMRAQRGEEEMKKITGIVKKHPKVEIKKLHLLPCKTKGVCKECSTEHEDWEPHNLCMYYQYKFHAEHGRFPTWADAIAHCSEEVQQTTIACLKEHGIVIEKARRIKGGKQ